MNTLWQDLRYGLRVMLRSPGFTAVAIICIALGVGVTTTMFSAVNGILVRALPFQNASELVALHARNRDRDIFGSGVSWADYAVWREENHTFAELGLWASGFPTLSGPEGDVERVEGAEVSANLIALLGVAPFAGRTFLPGEEQRGSDEVVVLSYGLWQRRYGGDPAVLGRAVQINGRARTVVGVMPPSFDFPERSQLWLPLIVNPAREQRGNRGRLTAIGRLKPQATLEEAKAEMAAISRRLEAAFPEDNRGWEAELIPLRDDLVGALRKPILILLGAAGFVLLIACANVGNLMLARSAARRREMAIRIAVGAGGRRIVKQVLTECALIALVGGAFGTLLAYFGVRFLKLAFPDGVPSYFDISIDGAALGFTVLVSLLTGILFGIAPALRATRVDPANALRAGGQSAGDGVASSRLRSGLVAAEVALSLILLVGAALLIRSDLQLEAKLGFEPRGVLSFRVPLPSPKYDATTRRAFYDQLSERLRALPGVQAVGSAQGLPFGPLGGSYDRVKVEIQGRPTPLRNEEFISLRLQVSPDYLRTMGVPLLYGRGFFKVDQDTGAHVGVINEAFAHRHFSDEDPLDKRIRFVDADTPDRIAPWIKIVGVAKNMRQDRPPQHIEPAIFVPFTEGSQTFVVRTKLADPQTLVPAVRAIVREMDAALPTYLVQTLDQVVARALWRQRLQGRVLGLFAGLALLLAVFGIYGVISYTVAQRTREFGVRMALGATRGQVFALVLAQGGRLALLGVGIGVALALALTRVLASLLYEVKPTDPATFISASVALGAVAVLAAITPAWRAAKVDLMVVLRYE